MEFETHITFEFLPQNVLDCRPDRPVGEVAVSARLAKENYTYHGLRRENRLINELIN
jgi:hypothetical protein